MMQKNSSTRKKAIRTLSYVHAIREAFDQAMFKDKNVIIIGEGVPDPKNIFDSTTNLLEKYGANRVYDMPLSENGITGVCIGAAIRGLRPILIHQRLDFALLSLDQIINNAAKWHYMFNGQSKVPIVIRMIIGRGWGQGPQHSQSYQSIFAHIPGLKVVMPATAHDAKGILLSSIKDNNPIIFIEHRWLHHIEDEVPKDYYEIEIGKAKVIKKGKNITIAAFSYMVVESLIAARLIEKYFKITVEVIDMRSIRPMDSKSVITSVKKTKNLIVADTAYSFCSVASELIYQVTEKCFSFLTKPPTKICSPDYPTPTAQGMTKNYYPGPKEIVKEIIKLLNLEIDQNSLKLLLKESERKGMHDVPNRDFKGPF